MEKQLKTELRKILTGRTIRDEEGWLIAVPDGQYLIYHGVADSTGYRKIKMREQLMQVASTTEESFYPVLNALQDVGVLVNMKSQPKALCALCRMFLVKAVVLSVTPMDDGQVHVQAYTGRSFLSGLCCKLAIEKFEKKINLDL